MPDFKIIGNPNPVVGVIETYSIDFSSLPNIPSFKISSKEDFETTFENQVKWTVHILECGRWRQTKENEKHGNPITYTFYQRSLTRTVRIKAEINGLSARIDIKTQNAECPKIVDIDLLDSEGKKPIKQFTYGEWFIARVHGIHMDNRRIFVTLWEDDSKGPGHNKANTLIKFETAIIKDGIADIKFFLDPSNMWLANAKLAPGDQNEGKNHEYYVTVEFFFNGSPYNFAGNNTNVPNPDYKPESLKQTPAEQKGISKKDTKGINKAENKVFDYQETKVSVKPVIELNPLIERYNKVMKVNVDDKWWEKKEEKKKEKTECYCYSQGIVDISCNDKGSLVTNNHFENLSKDIGVEAKVFKAVAIVESGGRKSFVYVNGKQKAKILYERHYMYRFLKKLKTEEELNVLKKKYPNIVHNIGTYKDPDAKYGSEVEQFDKLEQSKEINNDYAIQSCSWGKFQVMGKYYDYLYNSPNELEEAMNMCEIQHFAYFKIYLKDVTGADMIKAMKEKNWDKIAELYNGTDYAINKYHTKMKEEYEKL